MKKRVDLNKLALILSIGSGLTIIANSFIFYEVYELKPSGNGEIFPALIIIAVFFASLVSTILSALVHAILIAKERMLVKLWVTFVITVACVCNFAYYGWIFF